MGIKDRLLKGLQKSREALNELFYFGGDLDDSFWDELEDTLVISDIGAEVAMRIVDDVREDAARKNLVSADAVRTILAERIACEFAPANDDPFAEPSACVLFVGINGSGKTTTIGKIAHEAKAAGRRVLIAGADTFRAAAIEQLETWAERAQVPFVSRERGADPASVCYDALDAADTQAADLVLIDTAGRLHTSDELMRELIKVVNVCRKRSNMPVYVVLVVDATTGQNGLIQAQEFNSALTLSGLIITKLDGSAKGGIAVTISHDLKLPIYRVGVGEGLDDLQNFSASAYAEALVGLNDV